MSTIIAAGAVAGGFAAGSGAAAGLAVVCCFVWAVWPSAAEPALLAAIIPGFNPENESAENSMKRIVLSTYILLFVQVNPCFGPPNHICGAEESFDATV
jgi:hypothetical protein